MDDLHDVFAQVALWEGNGRSSFTTDSRAIIATAFARLSKIVPTLGTDFVNLVKRLSDELEASQAVTTTKVEIEVYPQKW